MVTNNHQRLTERITAAVNGGSPSAPATENGYEPTEYDDEIAALLELEAHSSRPRLDPLDSGAVQIGGGDSDVDPGQKYGYSAIVAREVAATRKVYGWIRNVNLTPEQAVVAEGLMELFRMEWMAPCANRDGRFDREEERAQRWIRMLGGRKNAAAREAMDEADALLKTWNTHAAFKLQVEIQRLKLGLDAVEQYRQPYKIATRGQLDAEFDAGQLDPYAYGYFQCRVRQFKIQRESALDDARGVGVRDYTDVKKRIALGKFEVEDIVQEMPWAYQLVYGMGQMSMSSGKEHRQLVLGLNAAMIPFPTDEEKKSGWLNFGSRRDDPNLVNVNQFNPNGNQE